MHSCSSCILWTFLWLFDSLTSFNLKETLQPRRPGHQDQSGRRAHRARRRKKTIPLPPDSHVRVVVGRLYLSLPQWGAPNPPSCPRYKGHNRPASTRELHPSLQGLQLHSGCWSRYWHPWRLSPWRVPTTTICHQYVTHCHPLECKWMQGLMYSRTNLTKMAFLRKSVLFEKNIATRIAGGYGVAAEAVSLGDPASHSIGLGEVLPFFVASWEMTSAKLWWMQILSGTPLKSDMNFGQTNFQEY